jgi:thymidine kinase
MKHTSQQEKRSTPVKRTNRMELEKTATTTGEPGEKRGHITLVIGCMFASKSSYLFSRLERHLIAKQKCFLIKYRADTRYGDFDEATTHNKRSVKVNQACDRLSEVKDESLMDMDVICVDEGQFFGDLLAFCEKWAKNGKLIYVSGLKSTARGPAWKPIVDLFPYAEKIVDLSAVCMDCLKKDASFSWDKANSLNNDQKEIKTKDAADIINSLTPTKEPSDKPESQKDESGVIHIGGSERYIAVCRECRDARLLHSTLVF